MSLYHDLILDHYRNPRNFGELPNADISIKEENVGCGDEIEIFMKQQTTSNKQQECVEIKWKGRGCAIATAAASILSERVSQIRQISQIRKMNERDMVALLGGNIGSSRMKCATLALRVLQSAMNKSEETRVK